MPIVDQNVRIAASTETAFDGFANLSLKPLLRFIAAECITSIQELPCGPGGNFPIVDFVVQLLLANKDHLENACRGSNLPADASFSSFLPPVPSLLHDAAVIHYTGTSTPHHATQTQAMDAHLDALKAQLRDLEAQLAAASASVPAPPTSLGDIGADVSGTASVAISRAYMDAGIKRRDGAFLREVFDKYQDNTVTPPRISQASLPAAMADLFSRAAGSGSNAHTSVPCAVLEAAQLVGSRGVDFAEFVAASATAIPFERYLSKLPLVCIMADALAAHVGFDEDALQRFSQLPGAQLGYVMQAATSGLKAELVRAQAQVSRLLAAQQKSVDQLASGKFQNPRKMACGSITDFHEGLTGRIGSPSLDFEPAMRAEHCFKGGHDFEFTTGNYKIKTTPKREWLQIVGDENGLRAAVPSEDMKHGRVINDVSELLKRPLAVKAGLQRCEVIALSMYSGPLFEIYNALLRRFPLDKYDTFSGQGNTFSTTIFVLVSAIQKLSRHMFLPPSMRLYRGFSSMEMPESFYKVDEDTGCCGYAEWGFISTTANKNVAVQYSGVDDGKPRATVLCIRPSSVDRGASIAEFSQYPGEEEYLWPPCSFLQLEDSGSEVEVQAGGGVVSIMSVRVNANLRTETVEELVEKKKRMHMTSARLLADEVKGELERQAASTESLERKKNDLYAWQADVLQVFCSKINAHCESIVERHRSTDADDYVNDNTFRGLVSDILNMKSWALEMWQLWLKDESRHIRHVQEFSLAACHRMWLSHLRKRIREAAPGSDERRLACLQLLQSKGLAKAAAYGELNAEGEDLIVAAGADGWSADDVNALLGAGADVATADVNGKTGVHSAAHYGHVSTLQVLLGAGGDVNGCISEGKSALYIAALNGHVDCIEELAASKADVLKCDSDGTSPLNVASFAGHLSCVEALIRLKADVLQCNKDDRSPLYSASFGGRLTCVEALIRLKADVLQCNKDGMSPLWAASQAGHLPCVEALILAKADVLQCNTDGVSPLYIASFCGRLSCVEALIFAKADVLQCDKGGTSPLCAVSCGSNLSCVEALIRLKADVLQCNKDGTSPLWAASFGGNLSCVEALILAKADVLQCDKDGLSPVAVASSKGHSDCVAALVRAGAAPP